MQQRLCGYMISRGRSFISLLLNAPLYIGEILAGSESEIRKKDTNTREMVKKKQNPRRSERGIVCAGSIYIS